MLQMLVAKSGHEKDHHAASALPFLRQAQLAFPPRPLTLMQYRLSVAVVARGPLCIPSENEAPCRIVGACLLKYGYARVSTDDQTPALQLAALRKAGCKTVFKDDGLSGATTERPARSHFPVVTRTPIWVEP